MSSNYPPGVSGNEPEIAGFDVAHEMDHREVACDNEECTEYQQHAEQFVEVAREYQTYVLFESWEWTCPKCGDKTSYDDEIDYDDMHDY
jgi:hypothetical protein